MNSNCETTPIDIYRARSRGIPHHSLALGLDTQTAPALFIGGNAQVGDELALSHDPKPLSQIRVTSVRSIWYKRTIANLESQRFRFAWLPGEMWTALIESRMKPLKPSTV